MSSEDRRLARPSMFVSRGFTIIERSGSLGSLRMLPYELTLEDRHGYLYANVGAQIIDAESALAYLREIAERCESGLCHKVLVKRDIPYMLSVADLFRTVDEFSRMMHGRRVAFLNPHSSMEDYLDFAMVIAANRAAEFKVFGNIESAERWLKT